MNNCNQIEISVLSVLLAREAFVLIRKLGFGRNGLYSTENLPIGKIEGQDLRQRLNLAGQLAEALHNLPDGLSAQGDIAATLENMESFLANNPLYGTGEYRFKEYMEQISRFASDGVQVFEDDG